ncbi:MAG TPA: aminofutalosine synthase MqnE [Thermoanaerobaculia bacterium]|nr:aminofutalosine synthase MqnE [Thermoanaerobaculia bacterium]
MFEFITDSRLHPVADRVAAGQRLDEQDGLLLFETPDLLSVARMANFVREKLNGDRTHYTVNRYVNHTNVCVVSCKLCAFAVRPKQEGGWTYSADEIVKQVEASIVHGGVNELHIVGGLHPWLKFDYYLDLMSKLKAAYPQVHLKAFTMVEIDFLAKISKQSIRDTIVALRQAGLDSCPGGGAEIFADEIRNEICDHKMNADRWLEISRTCHELGIRTNCTMLYGHIERYEHRVDHILRLRALQDETQGFNCFVPLHFHKTNTVYENTVEEASPMDDLRTVAVSRLLFDNVQHIKAYWIGMGERIAQVALSFGADDLGGTIADERIFKMAGSETDAGAMTREKLEKLVRDAGRVPVQTDTLYRAVESAA